MATVLMSKDASKKARVWNLITLTISQAAQDVAGSLLFDLGSIGIITLEENADESKLGAYFDEGSDPHEIAQKIEAEFSRLGHRDDLRGVSISELADQDWMQKWKEGFEPLAIGERLVVAPSWKLPDDRGNREVIQIDPGMAFGTGTHETTRLCLELIERHWRGGRMLDVGTGTGILAIAAALLEPGSRITAIDVDPIAVSVARENIAINNVTGLIEVIEEQPRNFVGRGFDMVAANLTAEVIVSLMRELAGCLRPCGLMILSGILSELLDEVEREVEQARLKIIERRHDGEWSALVAQR